MSLKLKGFAHRKRISVRGAGRGGAGRGGAAQLTQVLLPSTKRHVAGWSVKGFLGLEDFNVGMMLS